jgi:hypothetical protein
MRLNTLTIIFGAALASALPSKTSYEAALAAGPQGTGQTTPQETALVPEFVSSSHLSQFLMASEETGSATTDTRQAAEALSAKFAAASADLNSKPAVAQSDRIVLDVLDTRQDPKALAEVIPVSTPDASIVPDPKGSKHSAKDAKRRPLASARTAAASKPVCAR